MANWASTQYVIEGTKESILKIKDALDKAVESKDSNYEFYKACKNLNISLDENNLPHLGGIIQEKPELKEDGTLHFWAEERWGLQDFAEILEEKFPDIKVYWIIEECGCEIYATNDKEGKYFTARYWVDTCINNDWDSEYFSDIDSALSWVSKRTEGKINTMEDIEKFNDTQEDYDHFIYIHKFEIAEE